MLRGLGLHKSEVSYDIFHIQSLMIYTDLIEYNIVGDRKVPLLRVVLLLFGSSRLETLKLLDGVRNIRRLVACNSDHSSKNLFIVFALT